MPPAPHRVPCFAALEDADPMTVRHGSKGRFEPDRTGSHNRDVFAQFHRQYLSASSGNLISSSTTGGTVAQNSDECTANFPAVRCVFAKMRKPAACRNTNFG